MSNAVVPIATVPAARADALTYRRGVRIDAIGVGQTLRRGARVLDDISLTIHPGELVAIVGGSGAGKSTLLDAIAGVRPPSDGRVELDGHDASHHRDELRAAIGYVPQDDIIHRRLPVDATLGYAARLRLPAETTAEEIERVVADTLDTLGLRERAHVRVGSLSGGQRKRASIGVELLTRPRAFFLDEPTSGLDPATARDLLRTLRGLADRGTTVLLTTHSSDDLRHCDQIVFLASGRLAFAGTPADALTHFGVDDLAAVYELLADDGQPRAVQYSTRPSAERGRPATSATSIATATSAAHRPGAVHQWRVLTRRNLDVLRHDRLTMAIMLGSPALVVAMFAVLFEPGAFDPADPSPNASVMISYWMAFAGFFFGLTYGLLQICTELAILRRERFVTLRVGPYLAAKVTVLLPVLLAVNIAMLAVLLVTGRLPDAGLAGYLALTVTLMLDAAAALALGLLASAAVADPAQATLALPMLCFPAVLFSGAVVPVETMAGAGRFLSILTSDRWAFEAIARDLDVGQLLATDPSGAGPQLLGQFGSTFSGGTLGHWLALAAFATVFLAGAATVVTHRTRPQ